MKDSIELLEAIGQNASLRHASGDELRQGLEGQASDSLREILASGDRESLARELGSRSTRVNQNPTQVGFEEDEQEDGSGPAPVKPEQPTQAA